MCYAVEQPNKNLNPPTQIEENKPIEESDGHFVFEEAGNLVFTVPSTLPPLSSAGFESDASMQWSSKTKTSKPPTQSKEKRMSNCALPEPQFIYVHALFRKNWSNRILAPPQGLSHPV